MANGTAVAWTDRWSTTGPILDTRFEVVPDATYSGRPQSGHARYPYKFSPLTYDDASSGTSLDMLRGFEGEREARRPDDTDSFDVLWFQAARNLLYEIDASLQEDREEAILHGEVCASGPAAATCRRIASTMAFWLFFSSGLKWAAFGEDAGSVSLVLRSLITDRRADFQISADGRRISAIRTDESMTAGSVILSVDDHSALRETAAWVTGSA